MRVCFVEFYKSGRAGVESPEGDFVPLLPRFQPPVFTLNSRPRI